ncbi:putative aminoacrylate peracid reductase RutC [Variibacter gotjawalensis]|uniref:Putative aminoacrylate peracid reductase RutC n=1 Tax=Variibacter gotjawalensis TaxID=1333996 RepID=A0A0S3PU26_9BRAD|nr:RidA family protein [Variibacter gotjawalensis]NIK49772.1 enamine deaminase RidA (YjgF/YER057c/UK114 family) [Variibacter gotjawalensis]RZS45777.1 enamine deaminase RidA (YjgF/YER057c/UK114 family) [Variibacter gotjawalensis]BAT59450.1 putative aminoacrylate peracid reductase RutC [Variibacter gotjawalensis]
MAVYEPILPGPNWPKRYTFSPAVRVGNLVFLSGSTAGDAHGNIVGPGDIAAQTRFIFEKFQIILESVGGSLANIVETTEYVLSLDDYKKTAAVRTELFKGPPWPAATGVVVSGLVREGALIEIKAIAAL